MEVLDSIEIDSQFKKVSLKDRGAAFFWDALLMIAWYFGTFLVATIVQLDKSFPTFGIGLSLAIVYCLVRDSKDGESRGKRSTNILVIKKSTNERISYLSSILRQSTSFLPIFGLTYLLAILGFKIPFLFILPIIIFSTEIFLIYFSKTGQRLGDMIANTQVVYWEDFHKYEKANTKPATKDL